MSNDKTASDVTAPGEMDEPKPRLGLALSGGGLRASFYHIGVLARMAEMGLLRHVEVISTVSGGSIVGVLYYLKLKNILDTTSDADISDQTYVGIVKNLESTFRVAVQKNLRMRTFVSPWHNAKMAFANYSRSDRIGELYDRYIYRPEVTGAVSRPVHMRDLKIEPHLDPNQTRFNPTNPDHNGKRAAKVPILRINATSLNTGHSWNFMATYMGEAPPQDARASDIDKNTRLRRGSYSEIVSHQNDFPLGKAVAASAGVPGLFPPLAVSGLYDGWRVQLVDGGVFDNQGIAGLRDSDFPCTDFIVSDASGQMKDDASPDTSLLSVLMRTMDVLMGRVRDEMVGRLYDGNDPGRVAFMHLKRGLDGHDEPFIQRDETAAEEKIRPAALSSITFGVVPKTQKLLSQIRTDLDSFTDIEAHALEADGYLMSFPELEVVANNFDATPTEQYDWSFSGMISRLADKDDTMLHKHLDAASHKFAKPLRVSFSAGLGKLLGLGAVSIVALTALAVYIALIWYLVDLIRPDWISQLLAFWKACLLDAKTAVMLLATILLAVFGNWLGKTVKWVRMLLSPFKFALSLCLRFVLPALGAIPVIIYLATIDRYFVKVLGKYS